jgi:hypothetical protein
MQQQDLQLANLAAPSASSVAVLTQAQRKWQALMLERLNAAQMLMPDVPLVAAPRSHQELAIFRGRHTCT